MWSQKLQKTLVVVPTPWMHRIHRRGRSMLPQVSGSRAGSDAAKLDFKTDPELAAGKYRISLKSKLPHLASILDGHFVAGYQIWDRLGNIESRWF